MKREWLVLWGASALLCSLVTESVAAEGIFAPAEKKWLIRVRAAYMDMARESTPIPTLGVPSDAIYAESRFIPELDISYFITKHIAAELVLSYPQKHDLFVRDSALGAFKAGTFRHLPPTLLFQYHFLPDHRWFRPYIGGGMNYTFFFNEKLSVPGVTGLHLEPGSLGGAAQLGFDVMLVHDISVNFDVKKIFIDSNVKNDAGMKVSHIDPDPLIFSVGLGWRF